MVRLLPVALAAVVVLLVLGIVHDARRSRQRRAEPTPPSTPRTPLLAPKQRHYDWERRTDQAYRRFKSVPSPAEDRDRILAFIESREGVQAWVEPRTVMHPLSVVLVADDGEWVRFELGDDAYLRDLARTRGLVVHDAMRVGYPERMKTFSKPRPTERD